MHKDSAASLRDMKGTELTTLPLDISNYREILQNHLLASYRWASGWMHQTLGLNMAKYLNKNYILEKREKNLPSN